MSFVAELVIAILSCGLSGIFSCCLAPFKPQFDDMIQYDDNVKDLRERRVALKTDRDRVQTSVEEAEYGGESVNTEVQAWQAEADQMEKKVETWEAEVKNNSGKWFDLCSRRRLSKDAKKMTADIDVLKTGGKFIKSLYRPPRIPRVGAIPTPSFFPLPSSMANIKEIVDKLSIKTNNIIGVHGEGGSGKTTLIKQVAKLAEGKTKLIEQGAKQDEEPTLFDRVAIATVSQTPNEKLIQDTIAAFFGFKIEEGDEYLRGAQLSSKLKQKSNVLIILDDLWDKLDLEKVGIPYDHQGCKIIVTSREFDVCNLMKAKSFVHIKELTEDDALTLFEMEAGISDSRTIDRALKSEAAKEVIEHFCGRYPNSVVMAASALRNKSLDQWETAIQKVRDSKSNKIEGISEPKVLSLKLGYYQLQSNEAHLCLLFCCLFPTYYSVSMEELVIYRLVDRLFPDVGTLGDVWDRMHKVVHYLTSSHFLLEGDREGCFIVHDDTREVVLSLASEKGYNPVAKAGQGLTGWPAEGWGSCKRMSLMDNVITKLTGQPECPQLLTLFLQNNPLEDISGNFFEQMGALIYLDMSYTSISSLPRSLQCLKLRSLCLENTHLRDASHLSGLNTLEVLILRGSCVEKLPEGLEQMTKLKILDLSNNLYLEGIPSNVISKLTQLEELYIGYSFGEWEVEETESQEKASFSELRNLIQLTVLHIHVKNTKSLSMNFDGPWGNLRKFRICVDDDYWDISYERSMHLMNLSESVQSWVQLLLEKTEHLSLDRSRDLEDIIQKCVPVLKVLKSLHLRACSIDYIFRSTSFSKVINLEELHVEYCYPLKDVFHMEDDEAEHAKLTSLRELILVGLPKLMTIWKGNLSAAHLENLKLIKVKDCGKLEEIISNEQVGLDQEAAHIVNTSNKPRPMLFKNLQKLIISKCKKMKSVLALRLVRGLEQLEELTITSCNQMEDIISKGEELKEAKDQDMLPELKILALQDLPKLSNLYRGDLLLNWPSLQELQVWDCPNIKKIPMASNGAPKLRKFKGQGLWFKNLEWEDEITKGRLQDLLNKESKDEVMKPIKEISKDKPCSLAVDSKKNIVAHGVVLESQASTDMPPIIKSCLEQAKLVLRNRKTIEIKSEAGIFGQKYFCTHLLLEDIEYLCYMKELSVTCIVIYIRHLYEVLKNKKLEERYSFVNPEAISKVGSTNPIDPRPGTLADGLRASGSKRLFFVPYNSGNHWILIVIDPSSMTAYYLDPMGKEIHPDIEGVINNGLEMLQTQTGKNTRKDCNWKSVECPRQPTNVECGYFIMRYMKELIEDNSLEGTTQRYKGKNTFTRAKIDEVRIEWANVVLGYMQQFP